MVLGPPMALRPLVRGPPMELELPLWQLKGLGSLAYEYSTLWWKRWFLELRLVREQALALEWLVPLKPQVLPQERLPLVSSA